MVCINFRWYAWCTACQLVFFLVYLSTSRSAQPSNASAHGVRTAVSPAKRSISFCHKTLARQGPSCRIVGVGVQGHMQCPCSVSCACLGGHASWLARVGEGGIRECSLLVGVPWPSSGGYPSGQASSFGVRSLPAHGLGRFAARSIPHRSPST